MFWFVVALVLGLMVIAGVAYTRTRSKRPVTVLVATDLEQRIEAATRAFVKAPSWQPASAPDAPAAAAAIEAALIARDPRRALELAETALAAKQANRASASTERERIWLGWALCANSQPAAALDCLPVGDRSHGAAPGPAVGVPAPRPTGQAGPTPAIRDAHRSADASDRAERNPAGGGDRAEGNPAGFAGRGDGDRAEGNPDRRSRQGRAKANSAGFAGRGGSPGDRALAAYVASRAEHLKFEHAVGAVGSVPPLVTTGDLAVVTLARGRGGAAWLTGSAEAQLSSAEVKAAVAEHREITARCLERALDALALQPGFVDAAYLAARLAVKAGFVAAGGALFDAVAARIEGRPDVEAFERDRRDLADPSGAVANAKIKPVSPTAQRSRRLKVL